MRRFRLALASFCFLILLCSRLPSAEPLHQRIDVAIEQSHPAPLAALATDGELMRRLYLDFVGTIPTSAEARQFIEDKSPDKREKLIDRLLADPRYPRHMANVFDVMLMERRADKHVKSPEWQSYLYTSMVENKPFDQLAREILGADGVDDKLRPAVKFYLDREAEPNLLTRDVGRVFFGMDLQCAQCHDHPLIDSYYQSDYYGVFAFVSRGTVFTDAKKKVFYAEKAVGVTKFKSVFTEEEGETLPRLPGGAQIAEPTFKKGEEYQVKPAKNVRPVPKYSRRAQLAKFATDGKNRAFNRNIANRLWAHMMGSGMVDPVDLHHDDNPASHPQLLEAMADEFAAMKFDVKALLRELALSRTYQRSIDLPPQLASSAMKVATDVTTFEAELPKLKTTAEQSAQALTKTLDDLSNAEKALAPLAETLAKANASSAETKKASDAAVAALAASQKQLTAKQDIAKSLKEAVAKIQLAATKLPEDAQLKAAAATFADRAAKTSAEVMALTKTVEQQTAAAKSMAEKLAAAQPAAADANAKHTEAKKPVDALNQQLAAASTKSRADKAAIKQMERRIAIAKQFVEYARLKDTANAARAAADKAQSEFEVARKTLADAKARMPQLQADVAAAQTANDAARKLLAEATQERAAKQQAVTVVADAAAQADAARQKLPDDAELAKAFEQVKARADQLAGELAALEKTVAEREAAVNAAALQLTAAQQMLVATSAQIAELEPKLPGLEEAVKPLAEKAQAAQTQLAPANEALMESWTKQFVVTGLDPLTPEQLVWSILEASGQVEAHRIAAAADFDKKNPPKDPAKPDPARQAERAKHIAQTAFDKLKGNVAAFVNLFGAGAGQPQEDFFATVDQALFFSNGAQVRGWLAPSGNNLTARAGKLEDAKAIAEELYLGIFTRRPTDDEVRSVGEYLATRPKEKAVVIQEIAWALITSAEFRFSH